MGSFLFDPELIYYLCITGIMMIIAGLGWIIHDYLEDGKFAFIGNNY